MVNSASRRSRTSLVAMIIGGFLALAPVFGPLATTLHYLDDFFAERPQSIGHLIFRRIAGPDPLSPWAAHLCHIAGFIYSKWPAYNFTSP
jgi:hypothetical protein